MSVKSLPELIALEQLIAEGREWIQADVACTVAAGSELFPVHVLTMGSNAPDAPALGIFGGIHGLERIGTQVILSFLQSLVARLRWDDALHRQLAAVRLVFMPLINPGGMLQATRCNPHGVDLMRNSPVQASERVPFLLGGQRASPHLPWYRGAFGAAMELESRAVCQVVERELLPRRFSLTLDCHSGFGLRDRIWFPHAHTRTPIAHLPEIAALEELFTCSYPNHHYIFEPQSLQYRTHGDLWDHLYLRAARQQSQQSQPGQPGQPGQPSPDGVELPASAPAAPERIFLPLTLEMGSWLWVKKNPRQLFTRLGAFNPTAAHRQQRVLRSHLVWFEFLMRAVAAYARWLPDAPARQLQRKKALARWYGLGAV